MAIVSWISHRHLTPPPSKKNQLLLKRDEEVRSWSIRWERSNKQLLQVTAESNERAKEMETLKSKVRSNCPHPFPVPPPPNFSTSA